MRNAQWLKHVPDAWTVAPAWHVFVERSERAPVDTVHLTPSQTHGVLPQRDYMATTGNRVVLNLSGQDNMKTVKEGDFIIHLRSFQGGIEASSLLGKVSSAYTVLAPAQRLSNGYYRYLLKSKAFIEELANLTFQLRDGQTVNYSRFARMSLPMPPVEAQQRIADYLDRETNEIDAMIATMDELAENLRDRRRTTLSEQVLGGVSHFRDSDWLANIPSHWTASPAWAVLAERSEKSTPTDVHLTPSQTFGVLSQSDYMERTGNRVVLNLKGQDNMKAVRRGDYIIHLRSFQGGIEASNIDGKVSSAYTVLRPAQEICGAYFKRLLKSEPFIQELANLTFQLRDGQTVSYSRFSRMRLPVPPFAEQQRIADHLDEVTSRIDAMLAKVADLKSLLTERRAALITDVVTGRKEVA